MESDARYLLDTSCFLWAALTPELLSPTAQGALEKLSGTIFLSVASVWEMQIKHGLGKLPLPDSADRLAVAYMKSLGVDPLEITLDHIGCLYRLPSVHRDPFDRILVAQALAEGLTIVSPDAALAAYPVTLLW